MEEWRTGPNTAFHGDPCTTRLFIFSGVDESTGASTSFNGDPPTAILCISGVKELAGAKTVPADAQVFSIISGNLDRKYHTC